MEKKWDRKVLVRGWCDTHEDFLAEHLKKVFTVLDTPEEVALHNDMVRQIQQMVRQDSMAEFLRRAVGELKNRPRNYLKAIAGLIKQYAMKGVNSGS